MKDFPVIFSPAIFIRLALVAILFVSSACSSTGNTALVVGADVPYTKFTKLDGTFLMTDELRGKTAIVYFWAAWCNFSRPALVRLNDYLKKDLKRSDVELVAVSIDKAADFQKLMDAIKYQKIDSVTHAFSGNDIYDEAYMAFDADTLPHIFIIDPNGKIAAIGHSDSMVYDYFNPSK